MCIPFGLANIQYCVIFQISFQIEVDNTQRLALVQFLGQHKYSPIPYESIHRSVHSTRLTEDYFVNGPMWWYSFACLSAAPASAVFLPLVLKRGLKVSYANIITSGIQVGVTFALPLKLILK